MFNRSPNVSLSQDKSGIINTANGVRIGCLGGIYDPEVYSSAEAAPVHPFVPCLNPKLTITPGLFVSILQCSNSGPFPVQHPGKVWKPKLQEPCRHPVCGIIVTVCGCPHNECLAFRRHASVYRSSTQPRTRIHWHACFGRCHPTYQTPISLRSGRREAAAVLGKRAVCLG